MLGPALLILLSISVPPTRASSRPGPKLDHRLHAPFAALHRGATLEDFAQIYRQHLLLLPETPNFQITPDGKSITAVCSDREQEL